MTPSCRGRAEHWGAVAGGAARPELADKWQQFGELLRYRTSLPPQLSELAILVTARHCNCQLEWFIHARNGTQGGLAASIIENIRAGRPINATDAAALDVYHYASELNRARNVGDEIHRRVRERFGVTGVVELTA